MNRLSQVLQAELEAMHIEFPRSKALVLVEAITNAFDADRTLVDMLREPISQDSLPLCATPEPEPQNLEAALEASIAAIEEKLRSARLPIVYERRGS